MKFRRDLKHTLFFIYFILFATSQLLGQSVSQSEDVQGTELSLPSDQNSTDTSAVQENKEANDSTTNSNTLNGSQASTNAGTREKIQSQISADEQNIINSIKVSNDYDLLLWANGLGLDTKNSSRENLQSILLDFYGISNTVFNIFVNTDVKDQDAAVSKSERKTENESGQTTTDTSAPSEGEVPPAQSDTELGSGAADEIRIVSSDSARYFRYEKIEEDVFVLQGNVVIFINQKSQKRQHVIRANKLIYNETTRTGTALGDVIYQVYSYEGEPAEDPTQLKSETVEEFSSQIISFNIDDFNADILFGNTLTEKEVKYGKDKSKSEKLTFRIYSPHISRSSENVIVVSNASFTSSKAIPPIYSIKLKKIWLLKPDEWAFSRASVYLGEIPLFWIPFFVNPGDKFFFHPAIGYKTRDGGYINTTTYLLGQHTKSKDEEEFLNMFNFSKQKPKKKIIKGLYLQEADATSTQKKFPDNWYLRYLLDYYTGMGMYTAVESKFPNLVKLSFLELNEVNVDLGIALSQTVYVSNENYFNYYIKDGAFLRNNDQGYFFTVQVPFRYKFTTKLSTKITPGPFVDNMTLDFKLFSDSFLDADFSQRYYDFSWNQLLDPNRKITELNSRASQQGAYYWQWNNNIILPIKLLNLGNYVRDFSISNLRVQVNWNRKKVASEDVNEAYLYGPGAVSEEIESYFFTPIQTEIPSFQFRMRGTLFSLSNNTFDWLNGIKIKKNTKEEAMTPNNVTPKSPQERVDTGATNSDTSDENITQENPDNAPVYGLDEPEYPSDNASIRDDYTTDRQSVNTLDTAESRLSAPEAESADVKVENFEWSNYSFLIDYAYNQSLNQTIYYDQSKIIKPENVDIFDSNYFDYGYLTNNGDASLSVGVKLLDAWVDYNYKLLLNFKYRLLNYDENLTEEEKKSKGKSNNLYTQEDLTNSHKVTVYPLKWVPVMKATNWSYTADYYLGRDVFGTVRQSTWYIKDNEREWWKQHKFSQVYDVNYGGVDQKFSLGIVIPPYNLEHNYSYNFSTSYFNASLGTKLVEDKTNRVISYSPLNGSANLKLFDSKLSLSESFAYNYEYDYMDSMSTKLQAWWFSATLNSTYTEDYKFDKDSLSFVVIDKDDKKLRFKNLQLNTNLDSKPWYVWKDRISLKGFSKLSYNYDIIRFTNTNFSWTYGFNIDIYKYLSISLSSSLRHDAVYTYDEKYASAIGIERRNFFEDLGDSLSIWDENKLRKTPFKIGTVNLVATQDFGAWVFSFGYVGSAERDSNNTGRFLWKNKIELSVFWKPLPEFKSEAFYKDDEWGLVDDIDRTNN